MAIKPITIISGKKILPFKFVFFDIIMVWMMIK